MLKVQVVDFNIQWEGRISEHKKKWKYTLSPPHSNNTPFLFFLDTAAHTLSGTHTSVDVDSAESDHFQKPPQNACEDSHASLQTENLLDSTVDKHSLIGIVAQYTYCWQMNNWGPLLTTWYPWMRMNTWALCISFQGVHHHVRGSSNTLEVLLGKSHQKKEEHYHKSRKVIPHTNLYPFEKTHVHLCTDFATTMLVQIRVDRCVELIERSFAYVTCRSSLATQAMNASKWWASIRLIADIRANNTSIIAELWLSLKTPPVMSQVLGLKDKLLLCRVTKAIMLQQVVAVGIITKAVNCPVQLLYY